MKKKRALQVRIDDEIWKHVMTESESLGLSASTFVRLWLSSAIRNKLGYGKRTVRQGDRR